MASQRNPTVEALAAAAAAGAAAGAVWFLLNRRASPPASSAQPVAAAAVAAAPTKAAAPASSRRSSILGKPRLSISSAGEEAPVYRFVLTGGPCAGKTTALARVSNYLRQRGFRVLCVPEAATLMFSAGCTFADLDTTDKLIAFQGNLLLTQQHLEETMANIADSLNVPTVILCDRGTMDGSAYLETAVWDKLLDRYKMDNVSLREGRYNAVFHMVTAANGAVEFYSLANNTTRTESVEEAISVDEKLQQAWNGHPKLFIFDNRNSNFEDKLNRLVNTIGEQVGLPTTRKTFRRFLLRREPTHHEFMSSNDMKYETFEVEKVYVKLLKKRDERDYSFVRRRSQGALCSYGQTTVRFSPDGQKIERKRLIKRRDYEHMTGTILKDPTRHVVLQRRLTFLWSNHYFEIYIYQAPRSGTVVLNCQMHEGESSEDFQLPPFLDVVREVTREPEFSSYNISLKEQADASGAVVDDTVAV